MKNSSYFILYIALIIIHYLVCVECFVFFLSNGILYFLLSLNQLIRILFLRVDSSSAEPMNSQENDELNYPSFK